MVAPLDWGLGHATRCIPLIRYLINRGYAVTAAGEGPVQALLEQEFPEIEVLPLKGYHVHYPQKGWMFLPMILLQLPKIVLAILHERRWLKKQVGQWDLVISDNRYGLAVSNIKSVLITHQPRPITGLGPWADQWVSSVLYRWIHRFHACWIPDEAAEMGIAGLLSHPPSLPKNNMFIGPLSRLHRTHDEQKGTLLVMLSGPEPQRSLLEKSLVAELQHVEEEVLFLRGLPAASATPAFGEPGKKKIRFENHLDAASLSDAMSKAEIVICRSGYSSVMDLLSLRKKAILIPTPGQTEQRYIAKHLSQKGWFVIQDQERINLKQGIAEARNSVPEERPLFNVEGFKQAFAALGI